MREVLRGTVTPKDWMAVAVILGLAVLAGVVFKFFISSGQDTRYQDLISKDAQTVADLKQAEEKKANIEQLREETAKIELLVDEFQKRLPDTREIPTLVRKFEDLANEVMLEVELTPMPAVMDDQMRKETLPYKITVHGDFHQIAGFINRLERFERYLKVSKLNIEAEKDGVSKASFELSTFRFITPTPGA